jgi:outer membrane cobalamin receptor
MILTRLLSATALVGALSLLPSLAVAQAVPDAASPPVNADGTTPTRTAQGENAGTEEILITGSRIRRANDESPNPITTVTAADIFSSGRVSIGDVLNDLPQLRSTVSSQNSTSGLGVRGLNLLDLRGLGTSRTLVLVNGRRHVSSEIINNGNSPDINTFPTDLIEKIDIVSGGNSAVYGSDAIAGVVNFVLKEITTALICTARPASANMAMQGTSICRRSPARILPMDAATSPLTWNMPISRITTPRAAPISARTMRSSSSIRIRQAQ